MLLAGGSLAAVACGPSAHESPVDGGLNSTGQLYTSCNAKGIDVFGNGPPWTIVGQYGVTPL
jgi:hypothetical protein